MPELPEIETVKEQLASRIAGKKIIKIEILEKKQFIGDKTKIIGKKIDRLWRRAKMLAVDIDKLVLLIHLKMTGQIIYLDDNNKSISVGGHPLPFSSAQLPNKTTRVVIELSDHSWLFFNDLRKFGWMKVLAKRKVTRELSALGPEPLGEEFSLEYLRNTLSKTRRAIKTILMDQAKIAGIGNIYASEALFEAGIDPRRKANSLLDQEVADLHQAIRRILAKAIKYDGTSAADRVYVKPDAFPGRYQNFLKVYQREGEKCLVCAGKIKRVIQVNRSTFFCPKCQKSVDS